MLYSSTGPHKSSGSQGSILPVQLSIKEKGIIDKMFGYKSHCVEHEVFTAVNCMSHEDVAPPKHRNAWAPRRHRPKNHYKIQYSL